MPARPTRLYRPELDAVRFFLFLLVLFAHYKEYVPISPAAHPLLLDWQIAVGFALPVFFLLSAFLIVELLLREREKTGTVAIGQFYLRRMLRIWPLYFVVFYGLAIVGHWVPRAGPPNYLSWLAFTLFAGNLYIFKYGFVAYAVTPLWSISVEEQFYLTIPWLVHWWGTKSIAMISGLMIVCSYAAVWYSYNHVTAADDRIWFNSIVQFQFFAYGAIIAILLKHWNWMPKFNIPTRLALFAAAAGCWFTAEYWLHWTVSFWHPYSLAGALGGWELGAAGVVLIFFGTLGWPEKFVPAWAVRLGNISFGLYMFHSIALYLCFFTLGRWAHRRMGAAATPVMTVVALALMFGMAVASHRWLEMPFLRLKRRFTVVASKVETADGSVGEPAEGDVRGLTERDAGLSTPSR